MKFAPVIVFNYNRPDHSLQTWEALSRNQYAAETELYLYCDGPKTNASDEMKQDFTQIHDGVFWLEIPHLDLRPNLYGFYVQISLGTTRKSDFCDALHGAAFITILSNNFFDDNKLLRANRGHMAVLDARYTF